MKTFAVLFFTILALLAFELSLSRAAGHGPR